MAAGSIPASAAAPGTPVRVADRTARRDADRALNTASDLMVGLLMAREGMLVADTAEHAAALAERARGIVTHLHIAIGRLDSIGGQT